MANLNKPFGFLPVRPMFGGIERPNKYTIASAYNTSIYYGQPVVLTGTGRNIAVGAGTSEFLVGIFAGCEYIPAALDQSPKFSKYWPADTTVKANTVVDAFVFDDPDEEFVAQLDGSLDAGDVGLNCDYNAGTGSTLTGYSGATVKVVGKAATDTLMFRILDLFGDPENAWGTYAKVKVRINASRLRYTTGA